MNDEKFLETLDDYAEWIAMAAQAKERGHETAHYEEQAKVLRAQVLEAARFVGEAQ